MKFTIVLVIALVLCSTQALKAKKMTSVQAQRINEIRKTNTWAGILLNLAELHMTAKGPLEELVQAIEDTIEELHYKREKRDAAFLKREEEHVATVQQLESDIARCESDIADTEAVLEMLAEQKAELEEENRRLNQLIADTGVAIEEANNVRAKQHAEFETKVAETEEAIAAVDECLAILNEFANGEVSLVQVKNARNKLSLAQAKVAKHKNSESIFLNNLIQVAMSQEFADHGAIANVIAKFNEIRSNLYDSAAQLAADEEIQVQDHARFIADCNQTISESKETIAYNQDLLVTNAANTAENEALLVQLHADKAAFEQALDDENQAFADYTDRYNAWCEENDREVAVCQEALAVVSTVDLADYITDRVNAEDGMVSSGMATTQQHGMGTEVFNFDYQF